MDEINQIKELTNLILYQEFNFGIEELQISNLIFQNIEDIIK